MTPRIVLLQKLIEHPNFPVFSPEFRWFLETQLTQAMGHTPVGSDHDLDQPPPTKTDTVLLGALAQRQVDQWAQEHGRVVYGQTWSPCDWLLTSRGLFRWDEHQPTY